MIVRPARLDDLEALIAQCAPFLAEGSPLYKKIQPSADDFYADLAFKMDKGVLIVCEDDDGRILGSIGGNIVPFSSRHDLLLLAETWMYIEPAARGRGAGGMLRRAFEAAAQQHGCAGMSATAMNNQYAEAVGKSYTKDGYELTEFVFLKIF